MPRQGKLRVNEVFRNVGVTEGRLRMKNATDRRRIDYGAGTYISVVDNIKGRPSS